MAGIINIFGANVLGAFTVVLWTAVFIIPYFFLIKRWLLRVEKVDELIGLDVA